MKRILINTTLIVLLTACGKDKFNTTPEIKFKEFSPNVYVRQQFTNLAQAPILTLSLTDAEGDFGDSSFVYLRNVNLGTTTFDSVPFPLLNGVNRKNLSVEVDVDLGYNNTALLAIPIRTDPRPYTDTLTFEVYVKDIAKNKSNVIIAGPLYFVTP